MTIRRATNITNNSAGRVTTIPPRRCQQQRHVAAPAAKPKGHNLSHILLKIAIVIAGGYVIKRLAEKRFGKLHPFVVTPHYSHKHHDDDILSSI